MIARWRLKAHSRRGARGCKLTAIAGIAAFENWICTEAKANVADVAYWHKADLPRCPL
jgi:hypothetical protein